MSAEAPARRARVGVRVIVDGDSPVPERPRSGRPLKTRRNRRPDRRRVKLLRSYTIDEAARTLEVHRNTVRHWIKAGLRVIDDKRPILILGSDLADFLLGPAPAVPTGSNVLPEVPQASRAGGPDGGLRSEFCHLGRPRRHMPRLQSSDVSESVGRSIV
jgi:hypothetical protein